MANTYLSGIKALGEGGIIWGTSDMRVLLVTSSYTFVETHDWVSNITNELSGGNYSRGSLDGETVVEAGSLNKFDATDQTFTALGAAAGTPGAAIVYKYNAADGAAQLIAYCPLTTPPAPNGGDYKIVWGTDGVFSISN